VRRPVAAGARRGHDRGRNVFEHVADRRLLSREQWVDTRVVGRGPHGHMLRKLVSSTSRQFACWIGRRVFELSKAFCSRIRNQGTAMSAAVQGRTKPAVNCAADHFALRGRRSDLWHRDRKRWCLHPGASLSLDGEFAQMTIAIFTPRRISGQTITARIAERIPPMVPT